MNTRQNKKLRSILLLVAFTLTVLGSAQVTLGGFPEFTTTAGSPEGVIVDSIGDLYVSMSGTNVQVWKYTPSGVGTLLSDLGEPNNSAGGLAVDNADNIYVCSYGAETGVYRITPDGQTTKLPTGQLVFPDALIFDNNENLYVTEPVSVDANGGFFGQGGIWRIPKGGTAQLWLRDELLTGLAPTVMPFPLGANGIGFYQGDLYVANTDKGLVIRIPILEDGSSGTPEVWKTVEDIPESTMYQSPIFPVMLDGLTIDSNGNVYVTVISRNAIVRINAKDRSQETVAVYPSCPLDAPASMALNGCEDTLFITNLGMYEGLIPNPEPWPGPGLVTTPLSNKVDISGIWTGRQSRGTAGEEGLSWVQVIGAEQNGSSTVVMKILNPDPPIFGMFPDATTRTDSVGSFRRTGSNTWDYTLVGYGTTGTHEPWWGDIIYIQIDRGTITATDAYTVIASGRVEVYSGREYLNHPTFGDINDQDTDPRDGFPDADEVPVYSGDYVLSEYRMPMLTP